LTDGGDAEDFIAHLEPFHPRRDGFDHASEIMAQARGNRNPESAFISPWRIFQSPARSGTNLKARLALPSGA